MCQVNGPSYSVQCDKCGNSMRNTDDACPYCKRNSDQPSIQPSVREVAPEYVGVVTSQKADRINDDYILWAIYHNFDIGQRLWQADELVAKGLLRKYFNYELTDEGNKFIGIEASNVGPK